MKTKSSALKTAMAALIALSVSGVAFSQPSAQKPASSAPAQQTGPRKANIAVINLKSSSGVSTGEADLISDRLRGDLFNTGKVNVMERDQMQEILKEQGFQQSGACTNEACMVEMGQLLGVEQLITGSLGKVGSMFLVNLRIIDVKTAKITKVVSKDVKGSIEDVVGELGPIAAELVGASGTVSSTEVIGRKTEEKPAEPEQPKPETVAEPVKEAAPEPAPDERAEKNKNRAGIRLAFNFFGNGLVAKMHSTYYNAYGSEISSSAEAAPDSEYNFSGFFNPQLKFFFKAGPFITIDVGPSYTYGSMELKNQISRQYGDYLNVFGLALGVNFVKRWYPVKMNIGVMVDFNYLLNMEEFKYNSMDYLVGSTDSTAFHESANVAYGFRAGAEIMAGKHVGFNVDFVFKYSYFETSSEEYDYSDGSYEKWYFSYLLPMFALGIGVNFYY